MTREKLQATLSVMNKIKECYRILDWLHHMSVVWNKRDTCKLVCDSGPGEGLSVSEALYHLICEKMVEEQDAELKALETELALITAQSTETE
jgi:hypothetical protein